MLVKRNPSNDKSNLCKGLQHPSGCRVKPTCQTTKLQCSTLRHFHHCMLMLTSRVTKLTSASRSSLAATKTQIYAG